MALIELVDYNDEYTTDKQNVKNLEELEERIQLKLRIVIKLRIRMTAVVETMILMIKK